MGRGLSYKYHIYTWELGSLAFLHVAVVCRFFFFCVLWGRDGFGNFRGLVWGAEKSDYKWTYFIVWICNIQRFVKC